MSAEEERIKKNRYYRLRRLDPDLLKKEREYQNKWQKNRNLEIKATIIREYGSCCDCCGTVYPEFLTIDHIDGRGRRFGTKGRDTYQLYNWLIKNDFPKDDYRLMCMNCNFSLGKFGYCPHNKPLIEGEV